MAPKSTVSFFYLKTLDFKHLLISRSNDTGHPSRTTDIVSKNLSVTFKGHKAVLLKAIVAKTPNF